jgi:hypothetical protein
VKPVASAQSLISRMLMEPSLFKESLNDEAPQRLENKSESFVPGQKEVNGFGPTN